MAPVHDREAQLVGPGEPAADFTFWTPQDHGLPGLVGLFAGSEAEFWGFSGHEAFRISAGVEMMELKHQLKHHYKQQRLFPSQKASKL